MPKLNLSLFVPAIVQDHQGHNQMLDFSYDMDQVTSGWTQEAYVDTVDCGDEILWDSYFQELGVWLDAWVAWAFC